MAVQIMAVGLIALYRLCQAWQILGPRITSACTFVTTRRFRAAEGKIPFKVHFILPAYVECKLLNIDFNMQGDMRAGTLYKHHH